MTLCSYFKQALFFGSNIHLPSPVPMARLRTYGNLVASPGGRSFYSTPHKPTRRARTPVTPALKAALAKRRKESQAEYQSALSGARDTIRQQATQLRETFGGHSAEYSLGADPYLPRGLIESFLRVFKHFALKIPRGKVRVF